MRIYLADNWPTRYTGNFGQLHPARFGEWISERVFYPKRRFGKPKLSLKRGMAKLDKLVFGHDLYGRVVGVDIEHEPIIDLIAIGEAINAAYPYLAWGFFCATKPAPPPEDPRWAAVAKLTSMTWSQGWLNRRNMEQWAESIANQRQRWAVHFPDHCRAITMSPRVHPVAIRKGWYPDGWVPLDQWRQMWSTAALLHDVAIVHHQGQEWHQDYDWFQVMTETDPTLGDVLYKPPERAV